MDAAAYYRQLMQLGRDEFLASAAPAALVRYRTDDPESAQTRDQTITVDEEHGFRAEETLPYGRAVPAEVDLEVFPLTKKPGASFPDRITIGRTSNNDVVITDTSISRLHAYIRRDGKGWVVADAGSKNGSWLEGAPLDARREYSLPSSGVLRLGDVDLTFYSAADLYGALGGA